MKPNRVFMLTLAVLICASVGFSKAAAAGEVLAGSELKLFYEIIK